MTLSLGEALNTANVRFFTIKTKMISHGFLDELQCVVQRQSTKGSLQRTVLVCLWKFLTIPTKCTNEYT